MANTGCLRDYPSIFPQSTSEWSQTVNISPRQNFPLYGISKWPITLTLPYNGKLMWEKTFMIFAFCWPFAIFFQQSFHFHINGLKLDLVLFVNILLPISFLFSNHKCFLSYQFPTIRYYLCGMYTAYCSILIVL